MHNQVHHPFLAGNVGRIFANAFKHGVHQGVLLMKVYNFFCQVQGIMEIDNLLKNISQRQTQDVCSAEKTQQTM